LSNRYFVTADLNLKLQSSKYIIVNPPTQNW